MDWTGFNKTVTELNRPLLIVAGSKGVLACGYLNAATFDKLSEAGAIVHGVNDFEDMLDAIIFESSAEAEAIGVFAGMTGREALNKFR